MNNKILIINILNISINKSKIAFAQVVIGIGITDKHCLH